MKGLEEASFKDQGHGFEGFVDVNLNAKTAIYMNGMMRFKSRSWNSTRVRKSLDNYLTTLFQQIDFPLKYA